MNIIEWWNNLNPLTKEEQSLIDRRLCHTIEEMNDEERKVAHIYCLDNTPIESSDDDFKTLTNEFFNRMPFCNCNNSNKDLSFEVSATTFINKLFETYVDDDTLVISSDSEHPNVKKNIDKCLNKMILNHYTDIRGYQIDKIIKESKNYKKVFVYIIGTRNDTGEITPQLFFEELKKSFIKNNIEHKIILDDVQGMFLVPRDYRIFDYVIGTAHAVCTGYDMGILISNEYFMGKKAYNWGSEYLKSLDIVLKRQEKFSMFRDILIQYYSKRIAHNRGLSQELVVPYIFHMKTEPLNISSELSKMLSEINLLVTTPELSNQNFIQLRSHWFIKDSALLPKCIKIIDYLLDGNYNEEYIKSIIKGDLNG